MSARVVVTHPMSAPYVRNAVLALSEHRMLEYFATTYLDHPEYWLSANLKRIASFLRPSFVPQLERRRFADLAMSKIRVHARWEILRTIASSVLKTPILADALWERAEHDFDAWVARKLPSSLDAVYAFEHAALQTLKEAKRRRILTFYEQPSQHHAYFSRVFEEQVSRYPEVRNAQSALHEAQKADVRDRRRDEELGLADYVLCNSSFTKSTLTDAGVSADRIVVTPYGFPPVEGSQRSETHGPVVFMNAGTQNLRKGLHLLYRAWRQLRFAPNEAELWLIGRMTLPPATYQDLPGAVRIRGSIPHSELLDLYKKASVFVLPSLADGFGMVISEAMSRGLPVIATYSTGALDIIKHGETGFLIPAGDEAALIAQMRWCVEHRHLLRSIGARAAERAANWQWSDYRNALATALMARIDEYRSAGRGEGCSGRIA